MFAAFSSLGSNQKMKIVAFVDHNIILAWYGRARRTSGQAMPARRFPPLPAVLPEDIHIRGNNRSGGINQSM